MKVSRDQMQANRQRILTQAGRLFREKGFDAVGVAEVMKAAGLTHGGLYGHFASKEDLFAQTVAHLFTPGIRAENGASGLSDLLEAYLSPAHRTDVAQGCPTAALVSDIRRQGPQARSAATDGVRSQIDRIAASLADTPSAEDRRNAIGTWATMVGAVILARAIDDPALSDEILMEAKAWIGDRVSLTKQTSAAHRGRRRDVRQVDDKVIEGT